MKMEYYYHCYSTPTAHGHPSAPILFDHSSLKEFPLGCEENS